MSESLGNKINGSENANNRDVLYATKNSSLTLSSSSFFFDTAMGDKAKGRDDLARRGTGVIGAHTERERSGAAAATGLGAATVISHTLHH